MVRNWVFRRPFDHGPLIDAQSIRRKSPASVVDGEASGELLTAEASLISGAASGVQAGVSVGGGFRRRRFEVIAPTVFPPFVETTVDGVALGQVLVAHAELIPGVVAGGVTANGALLTARQDLIAGAANGSAVQAGAVIEVAARFAKVGRAVGVDAYALDDEFILEAA